MNELIDNVKMQRWSLENNAEVAVGETHRQTD